MSTYKLWELANREGVKSLLPYVEDAVLAYQESQYATIGVNTPAEIGEPLARYIHGRMMAHARPLRKSDPQPPDSRYTHFVLPPGQRHQRPYGDISMKEIIRQASGGILSEYEVQRLSEGMGRQLRYHVLLISTAGTGRGGWWTRPWPADLKWEHLGNKTRIDLRTEKRIAEEAAKSETTIVTRYSSKVLIPELPPVITPEWAVETVLRISRAYDALAEKYSDLQARYHETNAKVEELTEKLDKLTPDPWAEARNRLSDGLSLSNAGAVLTVEST